MFHRRKSYRTTWVTDECILSDLSLYINIQITMLHPVSFWIQIQELKWIWTSISKAQPSVPLPTQEGNLSWNLTLTQILPVLSVIQVCSLFLSAVLHGLGLESEHCLIENQNGTVTLIPLNDAQCSVNGVQITEPCSLNQGRIYTFLLKYHLYCFLLIKQYECSFLQSHVLNSRFICAFVFLRCCHSPRQNQYVQIQSSQRGG